MADWNPDLYLQFEKERTQPSRDLTARIVHPCPRTIVDLGCGPGNSTQVLRKRWPEADILGMDSSLEMIRKAQAAFPRWNWLQADIRAWNPPKTYDIVSSNATLQWIPDHRRLMPRIFSWVNPGGALAVQLPANQNAPLHQALLCVSRRSRWRECTAGCEDLIVYRPPEFYYEILSGLASWIHLWKTTYYHVLKDHQGLIDWYSSTGMRTYLDRLTGGNQKDAFRREVLEECRDSYPPQKDGQILYPFERLFFIAYRPETGS
jgi:trans-aconitate 2-methyltransferase